MGKGNRLVFSKLRERFGGKAPERVIEIHLYTAEGHKRPARTCEIVDHAEGLSPDELRKALKKLAEDKSDVSKGKPGRSLFGRGIADVLIAHVDGEFWAYKDGLLSSCEIRFDPRKGAPKLGFAEPHKPSRRQLADLHLKPDRNGSCVRFQLGEQCRIPGAERIVEVLSQFYMLRLINADPNVAVRLYQYRSGKKELSDTLEYEFPVGSVVGEFSTKMSPQLPVGRETELEIVGIVARTDRKRLPGREAGPEGRANGLLIVDEQDAVLDQTFLPEFEGAPYLENVYGIVRVSGIRDVLSRLLDLGKGKADSALTVSRDGFDLRHPFTKELFAVLRKQLVPIYRREEERYKEKTGAAVAPEAQKRIDEAIRRLNSYLKELAGEGEVEPPPKPDDKLPIQFIPAKLRLTAGRARRVLLMVKSGEAKAGGEVLIQSENPRISIEPESQIVDKSKKRKGYLSFAVTLKCDDLHEKGSIEALVDGSGGKMLEAKLEVLDVISEIAVQPPGDIEFRPDESRGRPNRINHLRLFANTDVVKVGRVVSFVLARKHGTIGLVEERRMTDTSKVTIAKNHILPGSSVATIPVAWRGSGWEQDARVLASTRLPGGIEARAEALLLLERPEEGEEGLIRRIEYGPRSSDECAALADGVLYVNSRHPLNNSVLGKDREEYAKRIATDFAAQHRLAVLLIEQGVYSAAEDAYRKNQLTLEPVPVTNLRNFMDKHTMKLGQRIVRALTSAAVRVAQNGK